MRRCTGFKPSRASGNARSVTTDRPYVANACAIITEKSSRIIPLSFDVVSIAIPLNVQFSYFARVLSQEDTATFRVLIFHQLSNQFCREHTIFHSHALEYAPSRIERRIT